MKSLLREIHRRSLWQILGVYIAASWVVLQVIDVVVNNMGLPGWIWPAALVLLLLGLPVVLTTGFVQKGIGGPARISVRPFADPGESADAPEPAAESTAAPTTADGVEHRLFTWRNAIVGGAGAFLLLFGFAGLYVVIQDRGAAFAPGEAIAEEANPGIAVLPFSVTGPDVEFWREGMAQALSLNLVGLAGLRTIDSRTVMSRWEREVGEATAPDLEEALEVARATGARYALLGDLVSTGSRVQAWAEVYDLETEEQLDRVQVEGSAAPDSTFALVNLLALSALRVIPQAQTDATPPIDLARLTTDSISALRSFLEGETHFRREDYTPAIDAYARAVAIDSTFALAHYRLSLAYGWRDNAANRDGHHLTAVEHADRLSERARLLVQSNVLYAKGLPFDAIDLLEEVTRKYPDEMEGWYLLGETVDHLGSQALRNPRMEGARALERVAELDPGFMPGQAHRVEAAFAFGDSARVRAMLDSDFAETFEWIDSYRQADRIAFGTEAERADALAALDTFPAEARYWAAMPLAVGNPAQLALAAEVLERSDIRDALTVRNRLKRGRLADLVESLEWSEVLRGTRVIAALSAHFAGFPLSEATLEQVTRGPRAGPGEVLIGAFLVDQGRRSELESWKRDGDVVTDSLRGIGNDALASTVENLRALVDAYAYLRRVGAEAGVDSMIAAQRRGVGWFAAGMVNSVARWWTAEALTEAGRAEEAEPYYRSLLHGSAFQPVATERLAQYHNERGDLDQAAVYFAQFIEMWADADPDLQPRVEAARSRLEDILKARG